MPGLTNNYCPVGGGRSSYIVATRRSATTGFREVGAVFFLGVIPGCVGVDGRSTTDLRSISRYHGLFQLEVASLFLAMSVLHATSLSYLAGLP
jgi:hypothetical protein